MLRHKIHFVGMEGVDRSEEKRQVVPRFKPPVQVEWARNGDMGKIVSMVNAHPHVELSAGMGAGKSTKIPLKIAKAVGKLVVHSIPFSVAAQSLASYLSRTPDAQHITYMDDVEADFPPHGVVIVTNAFLHAKHAQDKFASLRDAILYLDEIHESDCATAVIRELAPALTVFSCVVKATATSSPTGTPPMRAPGTRVEKQYTHVQPALWQATDVGKPWSTAMITDNIMINIDRVETRERLRRAYEEHGFDVRVCTSQTSYEYYQETVRRLCDSGGGIVVMLCDYSYRSSITVSANVDILDSREVAVPRIVDGAPSMAYRPAYQFEVDQFLGRAGRVEGKRSRVWVCNEKAPAFMCDLESLEADAANLLYRMMGFRPPLLLANYEYFNGDVPVNIAAAFKSDHPLALCPKESREPWVVLEKKPDVVDTRKGFEYDKQARMRQKYASCHTVRDMERPESPPPPVPDKHVVTRVDAGAMREYRAKRDSSPSLDTVFTLKGDEDDNLSIFENDTAFVKPKRVAKHIQEQRAAAAAELQRQSEEDLRRPRELGHKRVSTIGELTSTMDSVPDLPVAIPDSPTLNRTVTTTHRGFRPAVDSTKGIHKHVVDRDAGVGLVAVKDEDLGSYVYYHGMDRAPATSTAFWRGVDSVLQFATGYDARINAKGLPPEEALYAMRALVDEYNSKTAVAMGIQRLFNEVSSRPMEEWQDLVDHAQMVKTVDWMTHECTDAQARARLCRDNMTLFMKHSVDVVASVSPLEETVMQEMMQQFERAAVKKDPEKAIDYFNIFNKRGVRLGRRTGRALDYK